MAVLDLMCVGQGYFAHILGDCRMGRRTEIIYNLLHINFHRLLAAVTLQWFFMQNMSICGA